MRVAVGDLCEIEVWVLLVGIRLVERLEPEVVDDLVADDDCEAGSTSKARHVSSTATRTDWTVASAHEVTVHPREVERNVLQAHAP